MNNMNGGDGFKLNVDSGDQGGGGEEGGGTKLHQNLLTGIKELSVVRGTSYYNTRSICTVQ